MKTGADEFITILCNDFGYPGILGEYSKCDDCGCKIFVADSSKEAIQAHGTKLPIRLTCFKCVQMIDDLEFIPLSEKQKREVFLSVWEGSKQ